MKNIIVFALMILAATLLVSHALKLSVSDLQGDGFRDTEGQLTFTVRTATYNGQYAPRNSGAIWITNAQNQFVKTIKVWAQQYRYTLIRWNASSGGNTTGAVTGASLNNHTTHTVNWNGTNYQGTLMPDGVYNVNVEFTEHNATASNMGKYKQVSFTKGPEPVNQTIPNEQYFRDMTLIWAPVVVNGTLIGSVTDGGGAPVSGALIQANAYSVATNTAGMYELSLPPGVYNLSCTADGYVPQSVSGVTVESDLIVQQDFVLSVVDNSDDLQIPGALLLKPAQPNPFFENTRMQFKASGSQPINMEIFNQRGQRVFSRSLAGSGNWQELTWEGRSDAGTRCPAGNYLIRLTQGSQSAFKRVQKLY